MLNYSNENLLTLWYERVQKDTYKEPLVHASTSSSSVCPWLEVSFICPPLLLATHHFSLALTHTSGYPWMSNWADWLIACANVYLRAWKTLWLQFMLCVLLCCNTLSLAGSPPLFLFSSLSWQQWHIEGTAFWVVNLMELLTCGAVWINMAWRLLSQGRSIITTTQQTRENRCQCWHCLPISSFMLNSSWFTTSHLCQLTGIKHTRLKCSLVAWESLKSVGAQHGDKHQIRVANSLTMNWL